MRLLLLLILVGAAAYFTNPTRAAHEAQARVTLAAYRPNQTTGRGDLFENATGFVRGMAAGQGSYQSFYVASRYTVDMPGVQYLECFGAYTMVRCQVADPGAAS